MDDQYLRIAFTFYVLSAALPYVSGGVTFADETTLLTTLQSGYKQAVRPSTPTEVFMFFSIRTLQLLDITEQSMTTTGWLSLFWHDPRLIWNASNYSSISEMDANWVWRPEFFVSNSADGISFGGYDNDKVRFRIFNTGMVRWIMPTHLTTSCDVDIARFPFDSQSCYIEMIFLGMNSIDIAPNITNEISTFAYLENAEWQYDRGYVSTDVAPMCCPASSTTLVYFHFSFTRLRPFYVMNLLVPAMLLSACMVLTFLLPTNCGERLGFSMTILLAYTVLMTITSEMMPTTSKQTPYIDVYLLILLVLCSTTVLNVVLSVKMFYLESTPPKLLQKIGSKLSSIVFFKCYPTKDKVSPTNYDSKEKDEDNLNNRNKQELLKSVGDSKRNPDESEEVTWQQLADLQDRICFYLYLVTCLILIIMFVLALHGVV